MGNFTENLTAKNFSYNSNATLTSNYRSKIPSNLRVGTGLSELFRNVSGNSRGRFVCACVTTGPRVLGAITLIYFHGLKRK